MADDHTNQPPDEDDEPASSEDDEPASSDRSTPGGGPRRVVSDTSVDDILNSVRRTEDGPGQRDEIGEADHGTDAEATDEDRPSVDPDDLSDRVERGTVTGADVRQAETGDGRDSTPDIDDIDLSIDDIDATSSTGGGSGDAPSADSDGDNGTDAVEPGDDEDGSDGLLGRLKRLFSR